MATDPGLVSCEEFPEAVSADVPIFLSFTFLGHERRNPGTSYPIPPTFTSLPLEEDLV